VREKATTDSEHERRKAEVDPRVNEEEEETVEDRLND
jgi:hypothetical protein